MRMSDMKVEGNSTPLETQEDPPKSLENFWNIGRFRWKWGVPMIRRGLSRGHVLQRLVPAFIGRGGMDQCLEAAPIKEAIKETSPLFKRYLFNEDYIPIYDVKISVVIPVKNAGKEFGQLLATLKNQKGFVALEIIIVDSGSTDGSVRIAEDCGAQVIRIAPEDFSHSYARNIGAEHASGDYLLFTVQDALPPSDQWLHELFNVINNNEVVAVSCAEFPRSDADLFYRSLSWNHYRWLQVDKEDRILRKPDNEDYETVRRNGQLSDLACLISKEIFTKYTFRGNYAEDLDLGMRLTRDGYQCAFLSSVKIIHSHNRSTYYFLKRGYVDELAISGLFPDREVIEVAPEGLFRDIIFVNNVVNAILQEELRSLTVPCSVETLFSSVMPKLSLATIDGPPAGMVMVRNDHLDAKFQSFLERMYSQHYFFGDSHKPFGGIPLARMQSITNVIFEYMNHTYEMVDETVLEDFKSSLCKVFSMVCGLSLGTAFFRGSESTKVKLKDINNELRKEV